jgi:DNA polymerase I-like protein with 3'-5' exonuclease and polymerase domains
MSGRAYKAVVLGRMYGLGVRSLAGSLGITVAHAERIMREMDARYPVLNAWLKRVTTKAAHFEPIVCTLGWSLSMTGRPGEHRTFLNYSMQGNGSELMRLVIVRAAAAGLKLIACAHDGFFIEAPIAEIERDAVSLQEIMRKTARDLLGGFELRADCKPEEGDIVRYPEPFVDKREREDKMVHWNRLMQLIGANEEDAA